MQEVAIQPIGPQPLQRSLACRDRPSARGILRHHLRDEKDTVAAPGNRFADDVLGLPVILRGIDVSHAELNAVAQRGDRRRAICAVYVPSALADDADLATCATEAAMFHAALK